MKWLLSLLFLLSSCGGGGGSGGGGSFVGVQRGTHAVRQVVYYGGCITSIPETSPHVNAYWATGWCGPTGTWFLDVAAEANSARANGIDYLVIQLRDAYYDNPTETEFQLKQLAQTNALTGFRGVWITAGDEINNPQTDLGAKDDARVTAKNAEMRAIFAKYTPLNQVKIANLYACRYGGWPGLATSDLVGCDDYENRCNVLAVGGPYEDIYGKLSGTQEMMTVVGGSSPYKQAPQCFVDWATTKERISTHVWFRWETGGANTGIRDNGLRGMFCEASWGIKLPGTTPLCN